MLRLFCFAKCIYDRHVERRGKHGVEHLRHPWIVLHLDFSVWSVGCLGIFLVFRMNKACRCGIFHLPSLGDVVRITYHRRHMPHRTLNSTTRPLQVIFTAAYGEAGEERGLRHVVFAEIVSRRDSHIPHLYSLVSRCISPPWIYHRRLGCQVASQGHFHRCVDECQQVV